MDKNYVIDIVSKYVNSVMNEETSERFARITVDDVIEKLGDLGIFDESDITDSELQYVISDIINEMLNA